MSQGKGKKPAKKAEGSRRGPPPAKKPAAPAKGGVEPTHSRDAVSRAVADAAQAASKLRATPSTLAGTRHAVATPPPAPAPAVSPTLPVSASAPPESEMAPTVDATEVAIAPPSGDMADVADLVELADERDVVDDIDDDDDGDDGDGDGIGGGMDAADAVDAMGDTTEVHAVQVPAPHPKGPKIKVAHVALTPARHGRGRPDVIDIDAQTEREPGAPPPIPVPPASSPEEVATRIRELEQRLDRMIDEAARTHGDRPSAPPPPPSARALPGEGEPTVFDTARELLSSDFYLRKWGRLGMRNRSEEVDDFGFDPIYEKKVQPLFDFLYEKYFRVEAEGVSHVPSEGRCLLVANHSGTLPYDGVMIKVAMKREHPARRDVRWLAEDFIFHFPFLGSFSNRIGAVRACQENAERLLRKDSLVAVFPEGVKGIGKLFKERYQLQRFGRGGFIKLCLRTGTPIVPVAVVGAEETNPMLGKIEHLSKAIGFPYIPVTPTFPWLGPVGLLPAPTKWKITFGEPIEFGGYGAEAADDEILVGRLAERVRGTIQGMLDRSVGERRSVFFG